MFQFELQMLHVHQESRMKTESLEKCRNEILQKDATIAEQAQAISQKDSTIAEQAQTISSLKDHIANLEARLAASSTPTSSRKKKCAPRNLQLRSDCRTLIAKQASEGNYYDYSVSFNSPVNSEITRKVCKAYKDLNNLDESTLPRAEIEQSCQTYFRNAKQDNSRKARGVFDDHRKHVRDKRRKDTKLEERRTALKSVENFSPEELELYELGKFLVETISLDGISSEEDLSDSEDGTPVRRVRKLYWESPKMGHVKRKLDNIYLNEYATPAKKRKMGIRIKDSTCPLSKHPPPQNAPEWMLKEAGKGQPNQGT